MIRGGLCGEKRTNHRVIRQSILSLSLSRAPSSHLERVSMSLLHMWPPRCGLQEAAGWESTSTVFRFVSGLLQTSLLLPLASSGWYSRECASISGTLPSCQPCIFHCTHHHLKLIFIHVLVYGLSLEKPIRIRSSTKVVISPVHSCLPSKGHTVHGRDA